ncbi:MAG: Putative hydrolase in cluster with formaldehyde/S-nitrosomycothiol reductase MscR [uncultured Frankineae bacterium]|uniref:Hydrolase in cluster with formaldehyde/S-nitrosomycothiol reductase MscR n=1 Tax=uncultured Frankineae bacterium TaxID=437475 RepID=A0A6J4LKH7_9ACTN|nr:MAG: Putative hydrolase in cluster with formaldehyde/S-nitrosomycothiol reductase MscR [uncultured Frankineae bacterium]
MAARIEHLVTSGTFSLDGQTFDVDNNVWLLGDDDEVIVFDAPHDPDAIEAAVGDRTVVAIACTHAHDDHVRSAPELAERLSTPVLLHPADRVLWDLTHARHEPDGPLRDGQVLEVAGTKVHVLHTPGHAPGAVCFSVPDLGVVLSGDTLFSGGPGATGRSYSDYPTILDSIRTRLFTLPPETRVLTGHGDETTVGTEAPSYDEWVARIGS